MVHIEETKKKISLNNARYWLGKKRSEDTRRKISLLNKGKIIPDEVRNKISLAHKGKKHPWVSLNRKGKTYKEIYGDRWEQEIKNRSLSHIKNWDRKGRKQYKRPKHEGSAYIKWRKSVFERDGYACLMCGIKFIRGLTGKVSLQADHVKPFSRFPELRFDVSNGRTLCVSCHKTTDTFGYRKKTMPIFENCKSQYD